ncbi:MAG: ABC transporter ATP-binding protein [Propionibacteriales bacterium]|nr:ABC transporter ATP-binding protein [Propionibacteriales bacterium]
MAESLIDADTPRPALELKQVSLAVPGRRLVDGVGLVVSAGECVAIAGASGVGKTSLLNCASGLNLPASGSVMVNGVELGRLSAAKRSAFRLSHIGIVFQFAELLPELTALENVALPSRLLGMPREAAEDRAATWLERLDVSQRSSAHPEELSGGEQQRVGLARALAHEPSVLLADEPTGMLDEGNTATVVALLVRAAREWGAAVLVATHDASVASAADRVFTLARASLTVAAEKTSCSIRT